MANTSDAVDGGEQGTPRRDPRHAVVDNLDRIEDAAARTAVGWLLGEGLVAAIDEVRREWPEVATMPLPGLAECRSWLAGAASAATGESDRLGAASTEAPLVSTLDRADPATIEVVTRAAAERAEAARADLEPTLRVLAQLALGVTSHAGESVLVTLVERAAVEVLLGGPGPEPPVALVDESRLDLRARDRAGLRVELAGLVCRVLVDADTVLTFTAHDRPEPLAALGCGDDGVLWLSWPRDGRSSRHWPSPVRVVEPVDAIVEGLAASGALSDPAGLRVGAARWSGDR